MSHSTHIWVVDPKSMLLHVVIHHNLQLETQHSYSHGTMLKTQVASSGIKGPPTWKAAECRFVRHY